MRDTISHLAADLTAVYTMVDGYLVMAPQQALIEQALQYGLFDLTRLERLILERVAGDFFDLDGEP